MAIVEAACGYLDGGGEEGGGEAAQRTLLYGPTRPARVATGHHIAPERGSRSGGLVTRALDPREEGAQFPLCVRKLLGGKIAWGRGCVFERVFRHEERILLSGMMMGDR